MKICILQFDIQWLNIDKNIQKIQEVATSVTEKVDLMILPEMFLTGFCMDPSKSAIEEDSYAIKALISICQKCDLALIGSLAIKKEDNSFFNRVVLIDKNGILNRYDKQYLYSPSGENEVFSSHYSPSLFNYKGWKILPQVCYDLRFPENVRQLDSPDLLIYMANWPKPRIQHWNTLLKARAIENQCFTVGCNRIGTDGNEWVYPGQSQIIKADGNIVSLMNNAKPFIATLSKKDTEEYRAKYKFLEDKKQFSIPTI